MSSNNLSFLRQYDNLLLCAAFFHCTAGLGAQRVDRFIDITRQSESENKYSKASKTEFLCVMRSFCVSHTHRRRQLGFKMVTRGLPLHHSIPNPPCFSYSSMPQSAFLRPPRRTTLANNTLGKRPRSYRYPPVLTDEQRQKRPRYSAPDGYVLTATTIRHNHHLHHLLRQRHGTRTIASCANSTGKSSKELLQCLLPFHPKLISSHSAMTWNFRYIQSSAHSQASCQSSTHRSGWPPGSSLQDKPCRSSIT